MSTGHDSRDDVAFERFIEGDGGEYGAIYRRLARTDPPRRLDRSVLGEAARAVRGRPPRRHRWLVGMGSAAGIVLAAGIAWQVGHEAARHQATHPAPHASEVIPVQPRERAPAATVIRDDDAAEALAPASSSAPRSDAPSAPARKRTSPSAAPAEPPPPPNRKATTRPASERERTPPAESRTHAAPALPAMPAPPVPAVAAPPSAANTTAHAEAERTSEAATGTAPASAADVAGDGARPTPAISTSVELRRDSRRAPDDWLARIRQLEEQGRHQQARESLLLFQRKHPRHPIPADLEALLD